MGVKIPLGITRLVDEIETQFQWLLPLLLINSHSNEMFGEPDATGSGKSKMATSKPPIRISRVTTYLENLEIRENGQSKRIGNW